MESGGNQDQTTDRELNHQDDDAISPQASKTILHLAFLPQPSHQSLNQILQLHQPTKNRDLSTSQKRKPVQGRRSKAI